MAIVRYDPYRFMPTFPERVQRLFDFPSPTRWEEGEVATTGWQPRVDVYDQDGATVIKAELPGVKKEDIDVDVKGNVLTLKGRRQEESKVDENDFFCRERFFGTFQRSFTLPETVEPESVEADFKDGLLEVTVPKPKEQEGKKIQIR